MLLILTPPLRQYQTYIPLLARHFLRLIVRRLEFSVPLQIKEEALDALSRYHWPGNVRALETIIERLAAEAGDGGLITEAQARRETGRSE